MTSYEGLFQRKADELRHDLDARLDEFFLDIADNITRAMKEAGIKNKTEMAKRLGVSVSRVSGFLGGHKKNPELRTIVQFAMALGVEPHDLCGRRRTRELSGPLHAIRGYKSATVIKDKDAPGNEAAA